MNRIIEVVPYDAGWIGQFEAEAELLRSLLGEEVAAVHHIGSTSIPGMAAKPVIDILLEVRRVERLDKVNAVMRRAGYEPRGAFGLPRRRYFPKTVAGKRTVHVHAWQTGDREIRRHVAFRDFMIAHPFRARAYARLKIDLVQRYAGDNESYIAGKHDFCVQHEAEALAWQEEIDKLIMESDRLRLIPLSAAQLEFLLGRPDQLEAALALAISRPVASPPVVRHAIRLKQHRIIRSTQDDFPWHTYWLTVLKAECFGAGLIGFKGVPDQHGEVEIGYGIDPGFRRKGYTTEAASTLIAWALNQPSCFAVTAWSDKDNRASARVLEKVGMTLSKETAGQFCWIKGK